MNLRYRFGTKLRGLRLSKGLTLRQVSIKSGLNYSYISLLENSKRSIRNAHSDTISKLAHGLNTSTARLREMAGIQPQNHDIYEDIKNGDVMTWQGRPINKQKLAQWFKEGHWL